MRAAWSGSTSSPCSPAKTARPPTPVVNERIIMPPQGFLGAFNSMQQLIDKLVEAGVLTKNENAK